jgi:hypothetical protein
MWSENAQPSPADGQTAIDLTSDQAAALLKQTATANGGLKFDGNTFTVLPEATPLALTVDQKLAQIGLSVALLAPAIQAVIQAVPAPPAQQDAPA